MILAFVVLKYLVEIMKEMKLAFVACISGCCFKMYLALEIEV